MKKIQVYTGENVVLQGDVTFGEDCSVFHNTVIRADGSPFIAGNRCNIQDLCVIHADHHPVILEDDVTVGHRALLHGCTIGEGTIVGMGSILMDGAVIGKRCMIGAGSLITQGKKFDDGTLIMGSPARAIRTLAEEEQSALAESAHNYVRTAHKELKPVSLIIHEEESDAE